MKFEMELLGSFIAVEMIEAKSGVIELPAWQRSLQGRVLKVGPGEPLLDGKIAPMDIKVGDLVFFTATAGMESVCDGCDIRIMRQDDVLAVMDKAA